MSGPFVVTRRRRPEPRAGGQMHREWEVLSQRAVVDLDQARNAGMHLILDVSMGWGPGKVGAAVFKVLEIPAEGGSVPLPDGSEIEVKAKTWRQIQFESGLPMPGALPLTDDDKARFLAAWNDRHGIDIQDERGDDG